MNRAIKSRSVVEHNRHTSFRLIESQVIDERTLTIRKNVNETNLVSLTLVPRVGISSRLAYRSLVSLPKIRILDIAADKHSVPGDRTSLQGIGSRSQSRSFLEGIAGEPSRQNSSRISDQAFRCNYAFSRVHTQVCKSQASHTDLFLLHAA